MAELDSASKRIGVQLLAIGGNRVMKTRKEIEETLKRYKPFLSD